MTTPKKEAPILVAELPGERQLWVAVQALEERKIGRDFIGVLISEDGHEPGGQGEVFLVSVLAPNRLHEEIRNTFSQCGATAIGSPREMAGRYATIPHPGAFEDREMKLSMGLEYPDNRRARRG